MLVSETDRDAVGVAVGARGVECAPHGDVENEREGGESPQGTFQGCREGGEAEEDNVVDRFRGWLLTLPARPESEEEG